MKFANIKNVHFVGIGGIGMSGIAEILLNQGFGVSGSDLALGETTQRLVSLGAKIYEGHAPEHIANADVLVYSSAVHMDNLEVQEAIRRKIPVIRRAEMLAEVMRLHYGVAVAGTHGKTTTTSMIGMVLIEGGFDPTIIVGGKLHAFGDTNARLGKGEFMAVEADEYDRSFLQLNPAVAVLTTLEEEHLDIYADIDDIKKAFIEFANKVPFYGFITLCLDEPALQEILPDLSRKIYTYGLSSQADVRAVDLAHKENTTAFTVLDQGVELGRMTLRVPGEHNVRNALAAIVVALRLSIPFDLVKAALEKFEGAFRRFEIRGVVNDVVIVDDYAHHPTEVRETLKAIRVGWRRRVVCVFQPHTYTRTRDFHREFGKAFMDSDLLLVTDVYPAREQAIQGITGRLVTDAATAYGHKNVHFVEDKNAIPARLLEVVKPGDIVISMGAGDVYKYITEFMQMLGKQS